MELIHLFYCPVESASRILLSPCGKFGFIYKLFRVDEKNPSGSPNISVYDFVKGVKLKEYIFSKGDGWQPQWNSNSSLCSVFINGEIHMYANNQFVPCQSFANTTINFLSDQ
ncbi:unnamed protein product [Heterobilharzia americana]|nr:unnamed protein product [Heterobilharzia americana]